VKISSPPRALAWSWLALVALLGLTVTSAYQPLGAFNGPLSLLIAAGKALIVAIVFMELRERHPLRIAAAAAGMCWLAILLWVASADFTMRLDVPRTPVSEQTATGSIAQ
jgi:cytochrome c oxidase subunit 4